MVRTNGRPTEHYEMKSRFTAEEKAAREKAVAEAKAAYAEARKRLGQCKPRLVLTEAQKKAANAKKAATLRAHHQSRRSKQAVEDDAIIEKKAAEVKGAMKRKPAAQAGQPKQAAKRVKTVAAPVRPDAPPAVEADA